MEKINRSLALCGLIAAFGLGSCLTTTNELDLNKEISLDMQIGPGGLSIPLGSLDTLYLDSLIKIDGDDSMLKKLDDGTFGITMDGKVDCVKVDIEPLSIRIDPPTINSISTKFAVPKKEDLSLNIPGQESSNTLEVGSVNLESMGDNFNPISIGVETNKYPVGVAGVPLTNFSLPVPTQTHSIRFSYTLPEEVEKLNAIYFGENAIDGGQKMLFNVDLTGIYSVLDNPQISIENLTISFPENFILAKDNQLSQYITEGNIEVTGQGGKKNEFRITMNSTQHVKQFAANESKVLPLSFYMVSADFSDKGHSIDYSGDITCSLDLKISGVSKGTGQMFVKVDMDTALKIQDFSVDTKAKDVADMDSTLTSSFQIKGLGGMKRINSIDFDKNESYIALSIPAFDITPFEFDNTSAIRLVFSNDFEFDKDRSLEGKGYWTSDGVNTNILIIDPTKAKGTDVVLYIKKLNLDKEVDKDNGTITMDNDVEYSTHIVIAPKLGLNSQDLKSLKDQVVTFKVSGQLVIEDADFTTSEIRTDLASSTTIDIEKDGIDKSLVSISRIDIDDNNPAGVTMNLKFSGVPNEITEMTISALTINLPDFIKIEYVGTDPNIYVDKFSGAIVINKTITQNELNEYGPGLTISGFNIAGLEFDEPLDIIDGHLELLNQTVDITGVATVGEQNLGLQGLDEIVVTPTVSFNDIHVKSAYGKVDPDIEDVHELVELSLGEDNDFFQNDKNTLSLSDPQIVINLTSSITLPIDLDLSISSLDANGDTIAARIAPDHGTIHLPKCDSLQDHRTTALVIYKNERPERESEDTIFVRMGRLSELMTTIPDKIEFNLNAGIDQSVNHFVDLTRPLYVKGSYDVTIPLAFDSLYVEYSDTIKDLSKDLEEVADKIDATEMKLIADIQSTIPLGVKLVATAYDKYGNEMDDIKIDSCVIEAGNDTITESQMILGVDIRNGKRLADLESIVFVAACDSGNESSSIHEGQWLWIKKLRILLPQGLKVDLTEEDK